MVSNITVNSIFLPQPTKITHHMKKIYLIALAGTFLLGSCTMEKRHYLSGFYTDFGKHTVSTASANTISVKDHHSETISSVASDQKVLPAKVDASSMNVPVAIQNPEQPKANTIAEANSGNVQKDLPAITPSVPVSPVPDHMSVKPLPGDVDNGFPVWAYVLIALLLPPLAVALKYGCHAAFWLCLLFTVLGFLPGIIYALVYLILMQNEKS
jgi:uncharacterized membrane protein YqaE (UPF0057 family)